MKKPFLPTAFSLIELLAVMAIIALLVGASGLAIQGIGASRRIALAGSAVIDQLNLAQQTARSRNTPTRWQILEVPDNRTGDPAAFRFIRLQAFDPKARSWATLDRQLFPIAICADTNTSPKASTLLDLTGNVTDLTFGGQANQTARAAGIIFHPDGRTSLDPNAIHSLTVRDLRKSDDFITVQIDPLSGRTRSFRP